MRTTTRRSRPAPADDAPPAGADAEDWARFLAAVDAAEQADPDEPERWAAFFARLRWWLNRDEHAPE
jgi:hypothetical protein